MMIPPEILIDTVRTGRVFDLGLPLSPMTPHHPSHAPFLYRLTKNHGDMGTDRGVSASNDMFAMGTHVGTHIDGLSHIAVDGCMHGGYRAEEVSNVLTGHPPLGIDVDPPIICKGVLLDVAGLKGVDCLPEAYEITIGDIESCLTRRKMSVDRADSVLFRTGWARKVDDGRAYVGLRGGAPGPGVEAAVYLAERGMKITGSDTPAYERQPAPDYPVHVELLVKRGIRIIESLTLEALAQADASSFLFVALPLKIRGATGSPIRPIAVT